MNDPELQWQHQRFNIIICSLFLSNTLILFDRDLRSIILFSNNPLFCVVVMLWAIVRGSSSTENRFFSFLISWDCLKRLRDEYVLAMIEAVRKKRWSFGALSSESSVLEPPVDFEFSVCFWALLCRLCPSLTNLTILLPFSKSCVVCYSFATTPPVTVINDALNVI
jgi:hypothetical protein